MEKNSLSKIFVNFVEEEVWVCFRCHPDSRKTIEGYQVVVNNSGMVVLTLDPDAIVLVSHDWKVWFYGGKASQFFVTFYQDPIFFILLNSVL